MKPVPSTHRFGLYPTEAQRKGQQGRTYLRVLVDKYGFARQVDVVSSSGYAVLDQASIDSTVDRWRWEPPPPECLESGVILSILYAWSLGEPGPDPVYLDNKAYPAEASARKQGGKGTVEYTVSGDNKVTDAKVKASTGSSALDAAMLTIIRSAAFVTSGISSTSYTGTRRFEFIPQDNPQSIKALMGPAINPNPADLPAKQPSFRFVDTYPAPSRANDCGRSAPVFLEESRANINPSFPVESAATGKQGRTVLDVLVDKGGTASEVTVAQTSGSPSLDQAAVNGLKGLWHWQAPPPECADQGVHLHKNIDWFQGVAPQVRVMVGDPGYPPEAIASKLSGRGKVQITRSADGELISTKVLASTNSPVLDDAMIKIITNVRFAPGTRELHKTWTSFAVIDFVGDPEAMRAAAAAPTSRVAPLAPPPSRANDCGRSAPVYLAAMDESHVLVPIPMVATEPASRNQSPLLFRAQGALKMNVLVDKDGKASSVAIADSSAPAEMERAVTSTVKENYRWAPPPLECADRGVMLSVNYIYTWASERLQIYANDPEYPDAARAKGMGAAGVVQVQFHRDVIDGTKLLVGTNSPDLDAAMIKVVSDRLLAELRAKPVSQVFIFTTNFAIMFMPSFVSPPKQGGQVSPIQSAASSPEQATTNP